MPLKDIENYRTIIWKTKSKDALEMEKKKIWKMQLKDIENQRTVIQKTKSKDAIENGKTDGKCN